MASWDGFYEWLQRPPKEECPGQSGFPDRGPFGTHAFSEPQLFHSETHGASGQAGYWNMKSVSLGFTLFCKEVKGIRKRNH